MRVRKILGRFEEYGWETPSWEIASRVGLRPEEIVRLDTNASPFRPAHALRALRRALEGIEVNQYPDTSYLAFREALSDYTGKGLERFVVTNGADEGLDIASKVLLDAGDEVIVPTPTYSMYRVVSTIMGARVVAVPRRADFSLDVDAMLGAVTKRTRAVFLCNPNNPTGTYTNLDEVRRLAKESGVAVVVDEAYFEFCGGSSIDLTDRLDNVIISRTLSKAFSMAGVRVGYLVAKAETIKTLNLVRPPNSLSVLSLYLAQYAFEHLDEMRRNVRTTVRERERLVRSLSDLRGVRPYPSQANFVLFRVEEGDAERLHSSLMARGLVLRNLAKAKGLEGCLRTTVGTREVNDRLIREIDDCLSQLRQR
jgi:histidinol-phosphate aminotransferase